MADYNGKTFTISLGKGVQQREFSSEELEASVLSGIIDEADTVSIAKEAHLHIIPRVFVVNRGRNTGGGDVYVYWTSPNNIDTSGIYYSGSVPFGQLTDIIKVSETYPK